MARVSALALAALAVRLAESADGVHRMQLYDDVRMQYAARTVDRFAGAALGLAAPTPREQLARRFWLLRSVDVMSYTVGVQGFFEKHPPVAVLDTQTLGGASPGDDGGEGRRLWSGALEPQDPQAHEKLILDRLFSGLVKSVKSKLNASQRAEAMEGGLRGLDVGTGYGGWVRLIALENQRVRKIEGLELQSGICELAVNFSRWAFEPMQELHDRVGFINGDIRSALATDTAAGAHPLRDFLVSFLALLHIGSDLDEKLALFQQLASAVKVGGRVYFEDLVVLPAVFASDPGCAAKVQRVVWMNALPTHTQYADILLGAGFQPVGNASATAYDVTSAWRRFVLARVTQFRAAFDGAGVSTQLCLQDTGRVLPSAVGGGECDELHSLMGSEAAALEYIASQSQFVCEVCELFNGKGSLAEEDCACDTGTFTGEEDSKPQHHPPLLGGVIVFAERAVETLARQEL